MFLVIVTIATVVMLLLVLRTGRSVLHPATMMLSAWLAGFVLHLLGLIEYEYDVLSQSTCLLIVVSLAAFLFGSLTPIRIRLFPRCDDSEGQDSAYIQQVVLLVLLIALSTYAIGIGTKWRQVARGGFSLAEARTKHWDKAEKHAHTPITLAMAATRPAAIFLALSLPLYLHRRSPMALASLAAIGLVITEGFTVGGRSFMAFAILGCLFSSLFFAERRFPRHFQAAYVFNLLGTWKTWAVGFVLVTIFYMFFVVFPVVRNPHLVKRLDTYLHMHLGSGTNFSPRVERISRSLRRSDLRYFAYESRYLSSPLMRMNYLMNETKAREWFFMGGNNFTLFSKVVNMALQREGYSLQDVKKRIETAQPYGQNPWICGLMDVVVDFGIVGTVIFMFVFGCLSTGLYTTLLETGHQERFVIQALLSICIVSFPFTSRFPSNVITLTSLMAISLIAIRYVSLLPSRSSS